MVYLVWAHKLNFFHHMSKRKHHVHDYDGGYCLDCGKAMLCVLCDKRPWRTVCEECEGGRICDECTTTCDTCGRALCDVCIREGRACGCTECTVCDAHVTAEQQTPCEWCEAVVCNACAKDMNVIICGDEDCALEHARQTCTHSSGTKPHADSDCFKCDACGKPVEL